MYYFSACVYLAWLAISVVWGLIYVSTSANPANEVTGLVFWAAIFLIPLFRFYGRLKDRFKYGSPMITDSVLRKYRAGINFAFLILGLGHVSIIMWVATELVATVDKADRIIVHLGIVIPLICYFVGFTMVEGRYKRWLAHD